MNQPPTAITTRMLTPSSFLFTTTSLYPHSADPNGALAGEFAIGQGAAKRHLTLRFHVNDYCLRLSFDWQMGTQMPLSDGQFTELKQAYQILGVPLDASTHSIKQNYRRLVKRWHPDLSANGTTAHVEATQMIKLINEAYSAIAHAPLRYHSETYSQHAGRQSRQTTSTSTNEPIRVNTENIPKTDRLEFWVRFVCGALLGIFLCLDLVISAMPDSSSNLSLLALGALGVILGFGLGAARYGDKFWYLIFRRWWLWP